MSSNVPRCNRLAHRSNPSFSCEKNYAPTKQDQAKSQKHSASNLLEEPPSSKCPVYYKMRVERSVDLHYNSPFIPAEP